MKKEKYSLSLAIIALIVIASSVVGASISGAVYYRWGTGKKVVSPTSEVPVEKDCFKTCCVDYTLKVGDELTFGVHNLTVKSIAVGSTSLAVDGKDSTLTAEESIIVGDTKLTLNSADNGLLSINICNS